MELKIEYLPLSELETYENNAKLHTAEQIERIKHSILQFGMNDPIGIWNGKIVEGHGRYIACRELEMEEVPVIRLDHLTDEQRRMYALVHNQLTINTGFNIDLLNAELEKLISMNMGEYGFEIDLGELDDLTKDIDISNLQEEGRKIICPRCGKVVKVIR